MIFVTVGSTHFDDLVRSIDEAVGAGTIDERVVMQIGHGGRYLPRHVTEYFRLAPRLDDFEREADLVVGHGGTGTTLEVLRHGTPLLSVANPAVQDNHQEEFLLALEALGLVTYCRDLATLPELIAGARVPRRLNGSSQLAIDAADALRGLRPNQNDGRRGWIQRAAGRVVRGCHVDPSRVRRGPA